MNAAQYEAWSRPFRENPRALKALLLVNSGLKYLFYALYPLLLVLLWLNQPSLLLKETLVPAVLFAAVSAFRRLYNQPRPYEALDIDPLIHKDTKGKSFPSRHVFSVFMIAMCWSLYCPVLAGVLFTCGFLLAVVRVLGGVHYPHDVIAGAVIAVIGGIVGFSIVSVTWF